MEKHYIGATELLEDSFKLAWKVYESGYRPNYIVGVWRGGAPIGIAVQELFDCLLYTSPSPRDLRKSRMPSSA